MIQKLNHRFVIFVSNNHFGMNIDYILMYLFGDNDDA